MKTKAKSIQLIKSRQQRSDLLFMADIGLCQEVFGKKMKLNELEKHKLVDLFKDSNLT